MCHMKTDTKCIKMPRFCAARCLPLPAERIEGCWPKDGGSNRRKRLRGVDGKPWNGAVVAWYAGHRVI